MFWQCRIIEFSDKRGPFVFILEAQLGKFACFDLTAK